MSWRDLLQKDDETLVAPWLGGRTLRLNERTWTIDGRLPREVGWYSFKLNGRKAAVGEPTEPAFEKLFGIVRGYLVGDRIVPDDVQVNDDLMKVAECSEPVALIERGLDRFVRIVACRTFEGGQLVFHSQDFPLGAEDAVTQAYLRRAPSVDAIPNVSPALDMAFRVESWARAETERRRVELERQRAEEEARRQLEEQRQQLAQQLGTGAGRRALAQIDFRGAATAALQVGGAEYLDHKASYTPGEMVVTYRMLNRTLVCCCNEKTLCITDAGICLTDHHTGEKGDTRFTLESLPGVVRYAHGLGKLVVLRHTGDEDRDIDDYDD